MPYQEIDLDVIDPSPFQTRKEYDKDILVSLMSTATDELGIRNAPLVRPTDSGRYQIASGHGRVEAWKALEKKTIMCRVEKLSDSQMKKEILVENVNRSDLSEEERFQATEQYRLDPDTIDVNIKNKLLIKEYGWLTELSRQTGIPLTTLHRIYDVQEIHNHKVFQLEKLSEKISSAHIIQTQGLDKEDRIKLLVKSADMGWSNITTFKVKTAIKEMKPEVRSLLLEEETKLPHKVIVALGEIEEIHKQKQVIERIKLLKYNEELALDLIERAKLGDLTEEIKVIDEREEVLKDLNRAYELVRGFGINQYYLLGAQWTKVEEIISKIEQEIIRLKMLRAEVEGKVIVNG